MSEIVPNPCRMLVHSAGYKFAYDCTSKRIVLMRAGVRVRGGMKIELVDGKGPDDIHEVGAAIVAFLNSEQR